MRKLSNIQPLAMISLFGTGKDEECSTKPFAYKKEDGKDEPELFYFNLDNKTYNTINLEWLIQDGQRIINNIEKEKRNPERTKKIEPSTLILLPCPADKDLDILFESHGLNSLLKMEMAQKLTQSYSSQFIGLQSADMYNQRFARGRQKAEFESLFINLVIREPQKLGLKVIKMIQDSKSRRMFIFYSKRENGQQVLNTLQELFDFKQIEI